MSRNNKCRHEEIEIVGKALFTKDWKSPLARELGYDVRRLWQWLKNERPVPDAVWGEMRALLLKKRKQVEEALQLLDKKGIKKE